MASWILRASAMAWESQVHSSEAPSTPVLTSVMGLPLPEPTQPGWEKGRGVRLGVAVHAVGRRLYHREVQRLPGSR